MDVDDESLAQAAGNGDREAFRLLLERHYDRVYRIAWRFVGNQSDAEDIAQDVCIGLARKLKSFKGDSRFTTWLYRVAVNSCKDALRRQASATKAQEAYAELEPMTRADTEANAEQAAWLYGALGTLADDLRETAILVLAEDLSHAEAGAVLQVKEGTISWRMSEVRKQLKAIAQAESGQVI